MLGQALSERNPVCSIARVPVEDDYRSQLFVSGSGHEPAAQQKPVVGAVSHVLHSGADQGYVGHLLSREVDETALRHPDQGNGQEHSDRDRYEPSHHHPRYVTETGDRVLQSFVCKQLNGCIHTNGCVDSAGSWANTTPLPPWRRD